jgi:hypothetical protein
MNDDQQRIDDLLREWGAEQRDTAPDVRVPTERLNRPAGQRRLVAIGSAAALVVAVAVGIAFTRSDHNSPTRAGQSAPPTAASSGESAQPGYQQITYHRLAIDVPADWPLNATRCGAALQNTVILPGVVASCAGGGGADLTYVEMGGSPAFVPKLDSSETSTITIGTTSATQITGHRGTSTVIIIDDPDAFASVVITSPDAAEAQRLASSLQVVDVDSNSCQVRTAYRPLTETTDSGRAGATAALIPGTPSAITVCTYRAGLLEHGQPVPAADLASFIDTINALPTGLSRAADQFNTAAKCEPSSPPDAALDRTDYGMYEYTIKVDYDTGPQLTIHARIAFCGDLGASNGSRTGQRTYELEHLLSSVSGVSVSWPENVHPAP